MKVNIDDIAFWMDAIRNSDNHYSVLESFWKGQLKSKVWLIENLEKYATQKNNSVIIHGGWNGVLASLLFNSSIDIEKITSIDIDDTCQETAAMINKRFEILGKFEAVTHDMTTYVYKTIPNIVINTSSEHINQEQYNLWLDKIPDNTLVVIQNNNYHALPEHIRTFNSVDEFEYSSKLSNILFKGTLELPLYNRFLIIGYK